MTLTWKTVYYPMRVVNPNMFDDNDIEGDACYYFEVIAYSGSVKIATLKVSLNGLNNDRYAPYCAVVSIYLTSKIISKKSWYDSGKNELGTYKPCPMNTISAMKYVEDEFNKKIKLMGLTK